MRVVDGEIEINKIMNGKYIKNQVFVFTWSETPRSKRASGCCACSCSYVVSYKIYL